MTPLADHETRLRERFPEAVVEAISAPDMGVLVVRPDDIVGVLTHLRDAGFDVLTDLSAVDWLRSEAGASRHPGEPRYDVNYTLYSMTTHERLRVKVRLSDEESPHIASATSVWSGANWHEREVYDFFGIVFDGHPDLRRILMPDEWIGHPLRKDYPVGGVPVEYRIEPAYVGQNVVPPTTRPAAGGVPARLRRDRGRASHWTWTGPPASGVPPREGEGEPSREGEES